MEYGRTYGLPQSGCISCLNIPFFNISGQSECGTGKATSTEVVDQGRWHSEANRTGQSNESTGSHPLWKELEGGRLDEGVDWHELQCPEGWAVRK